MPIAKNGDIEVFYETSGSGQPLVLIMGLGADHSVWEQHLAAYEERFHCLAIDNRGVGRSSKPSGPYSTAEMARDVVSAMDHAGISNAHVAGISMGGAIAQELALHSPDRVRSVVLTSSWARLPPFNAQVFEHFKAIRTHCRTTDFQLCLQLWIWGPDWFSSQASSLALARGDAERNPAPQPQYAFEHQCDACIRHDTLDRLPSLRTPTLITVGELDIFTPLALSEAMHRAIPGSELVVMPRSGHTHHWEQVARFNSLTTEFMLRH
jgi:pimeloyl-ACP methyl ester carboxylesterase